jgi:phosphatidate cytidylyltransferase
MPVHSEVTLRRASPALRRSLVALVGIPLVFFVAVRTPPLGFALLVLFCLAIAFAEFLRLRGVADWILAGISCAAGVIACASFFAGSPAVVLGVLVGCAFALCLAGLVSSVRGISAAVESTAAGLMGLLYLAVPIGFLIFLRQSRDGAWAAALVLTVTFGREVGAFLVGSTIRSVPLLPAVSPRKGLSGLLGGFAGAAMALAAFMGVFYPGSLARRDAAALTILVGFLTQAGDYFESLLKRHAGARDSGTLLGDQGGMLDTIDGFVFNAPAVYYYLLLTGRVG